MDRSAHLSPEELQTWLDGQAGDGAAPERQQHVALCAECRQLISMHEYQQARLGGLEGKRAAAAGPECPGQDCWPRLAAGLIEGPEADRLLDHAAECDFCGPALHDAAKAFSDEPDQQVDEIIQKLNTGTPAWRREMARQAAQISNPRRAPNPWRRYAWVAIAAGVCVAAWLGTWVQRPAWFAAKSDGAATSMLISQAYAEMRPFEQRIPQAQYSPLRAQRGGMSPSAKPLALSEAEVQIRKKLIDRPDSAPWLDLEGRLEMLESHSEAAVETLRRALESKPDDPQILADLGSAYALRAQAHDRPEDYSAALEFLGRSLQKRPNAPEVVFNRALVCERLNLYSEATRAWENYLTLDRSGKWADEARRKLEELKKKAR